MKNSVLFRRILIVSGLHIAALVLGPSALAQSVLPTERDPGLERMEDIPSRDSATMTFEGVVLAPDGTRAEGAVVVASAGGQGVTDAGGRFRFEVQVPLEAQRVQITAVGGPGGNLVANQLVTLFPTAGSFWLGPLQLAKGVECLGLPSWLPTFGGMPGTDDDILALTVFDDGGGAALYAGGGFTIAGGIAANRIAKWDGSNWAALGSGMSNPGPVLPLVKALAVFDDGRGAALYAGGVFTSAIDSGDSFLAKWGCE